MTHAHPFNTAKPVRIPKALRAELEEAVAAHLTAVDKLTALLDKADGDEDLEPSIGHHPFGRPSALVDCEGGDVQDEPHDVEDEGNNEASLAHTNDFNQPRAQRHLGTLRIGDTWVTGGEDMESEHDGREPQCEDEGAQCDDEGAASDSEPSLGALHHIGCLAGDVNEGFNQTGWANGNTEDLEEGGR